MRERLRGIVRVLSALTGRLARLPSRPGREFHGPRVHLASVLWAVSAGVVFWSVLSPMSSARSAMWQLSAESSALDADRAALAQLRTLRARLETLKAVQLPRPRGVSVSDLARVPLVLHEMLPEGVRVAEWSYSPAPGRQDQASLTLVCRDFDSMVLALGTVSSIDGVLVESVSATPAVPGTRGRQYGESPAGIRLLVRIVRTTPRQDRPAAGPRVDAGEVR